MMKNQERRIIVFDFEVTPSLWMVTFIDYHTKKQLTIINDNKKLRSFYEKAKNEIFVSYNGRTYDIPIFKAILLGLNPYRISMELIENNKKAYQVLPKEHKQIEKELNDSTAGFLRTKLAGKIELRHIPKIRFKYDESIAYGNNIDNLLNKIHEKDGE